MYEIEKVSTFADVCQAAFRAMDEGRADVAVFSLLRDGTETVLTVGGIWKGDEYTWRAVAGRQAAIMDPDAGDHIYTGQGDEMDAASAARKMAEIVYQLGVENWRIEF